MEESPSSRRAWIEIVLKQTDKGDGEKSPSSRRAWIEIRMAASASSHSVRSPSSRRAWIEIIHPEPVNAQRKVALLAEGVDRNILNVRLGRTPRGRPPRGGRG